MYSSQDRTGELPGYTAVGGVGDSPIHRFFAKFWIRFSGGNHAD